MKESSIKAVFTLTLLFMGTLSLLAQNHFPSQLWHKGNIYDTDGQTYAGLVKYDLENNLVQLKNETISTFAASNVSHFEIHNETNEGLRTFYSLPYSINANNETSVFFEVLTEGKDITLLSRDYIETKYRSIGSKGFNGPTNDGIKVDREFRLAFNYYFFKDNEIQMYSLNKKDLFAIFPGYEDEINLFMRKNRLEHDKRGDLLRITAYYNDLKN